MPTRSAQMLWYLGLLIVAVLTRWIPHLPNVTALGAVTLVGAAYYHKSIWAWLVPISALWISDLVLNNVIHAEYYEGFTLWTQGSLWIFSAVILTIPCCAWIFRKKKSLLQMVLGSIGAGLIFFALSNLGTFLTTQMYPKTPTGLMACYAAALPFLRNSILGNLIFVGLLFPTFEWYRARFLSSRLSGESVSK